MKKRSTFEEAAQLTNTIQAPPRLPYHADVNGNPVYQQFMRLTHVYEEDELVKRQDEMQALAARLAMVQGLSTGRPMPSVPVFQMAGQGPTETPMQTPATTPRPGAEGQMAGLAEGERLSGEVQADLQLARLTDEQQREAQLRQQGFARTREVLGQMAAGAQNALSGALRSLQEVGQERTAREWAAGAYVAATAWLPLAGFTAAGGQALAGDYGAAGQIALAAGSVGAAEAILRLSAYLSATWNSPELAGTRETLRQILAAASGPQVRENEEREGRLVAFQEAIAEAARREEWVQRAAEGDELARRFLSALREVAGFDGELRPTTNFPDPTIIDVTDEYLYPEIENVFVRERMGLPALEDRRPELDPSPSPLTERITPMDQEPTPPAPPPAAAAPAPAAAAPEAAGGRRGQLRLSEAEITELVTAMESRSPVGGEEQDVGENTVFRFNNRITMRLSRGAQRYLRLEYPNRLGFKILTKAGNQVGPEDEVLRQEVFDEAKRLAPTSDRELAAVRDFVLRRKGQAPGSPGEPAPPTAVMGAAPMTPAQPGRARPLRPGSTPPSLPRPPGPRPATGASGSGLPR